jgi:hypothetical protein
MTDAVQIALIAAAPPTLVAIGAIIISWRNGKKTDELKVATTDLKVTVDGNMEKFIALAVESARAKGVLDEKEARKLLDAAAMASEEKGALREREKK